MNNLPFPEFPPEAFAKQDSGDDLAFYAPPRLVMHIDEKAVAALESCYRRVLPEGGRLLDLMSSWVSHLPGDRHYAAVIGQGMNPVELAANPRLTRWFVQNLNQSPVLPLEDQACDAAMACVGVQYLQQPLAVFAEVRRVLVPGALFIVSFSNRCFPTKAVAIWRALDMRGQAALVTLYLARAGHARASGLGDALSGASRIYRRQCDYADRRHGRRSVGYSNRPGTPVLNYPTFKGLGQNPIPKHIWLMQPWPDGRAAKALARRPARAKRDLACLTAGAPWGRVLPKFTAGPCGI